MPRKSVFDTKRPKLGGGLDAPIKIPRPPQHPMAGTMLLMPETMKKFDKDFSAWQKTVASIRKAEGGKRLAALISLYSRRGVDVSDPWKLIFAIIHDYVPAFEVVTEGRRGAPIRMDDMKLLRIYCEVEHERNAIKNRQAATVKKACERLAKRYNCQAATINKQYMRAKKSPTMAFVEKLQSIYPGRSCVQLIENIF